MISVILYGRNDSYGYNLHKRAALSFNCIAEVLTHPDDEIIFVDCNTPDDLPTFPESIRDTLTERAKKLLRILRFRPASYEKGKNGTKMKVLEPLCRNVAMRRSNPKNRWILNTNTDIVFVPVKPGQSLSEIVAKLPDCLYELPRFEMPEILWESTDRLKPQETIEQFKHWGRRLHLNECVIGNPENVFDGPGDFQLAPRQQMFAIHGMNEQMVLGWHVDSNLCRRLFLLNGKTSSLLDHYHSYHCDHTRVNTMMHTAEGGTANDWRHFVNDVHTPYIPQQAETWGMPHEPVEEIRLTAEHENRYLRVLEQMLPGLDAPMLHNALVGEAYNHGLLYDIQHALPYITDHLSQIPATADIGYVGGNAGFIKLITEFRKNFGHTGKTLFDPEAMSAGDGRGPLPQECVATEVGQLYERSFVVCLDLWMGNFPVTKNRAGYTVPKPSPEGGRFAALMMKRLHTFARREKQRFDANPHHTKKFLFFGTQNTWFEDATTQLFGIILTPFSSYVRHGYVRKDAFAKPFRAVPGEHLLVGDTLQQKTAWLAAQSRRPLTDLQFRIADMRVDKALTALAQGTPLESTGDLVVPAMIEFRILLAEVNGLLDEATQLRLLQSQLQTAPASSAPAASARPAKRSSIGKPIIAVDGQTFYCGDSMARGVGHYAFHHLQKCAELKPDWEFWILGDPAGTSEAISRLLKLPNVRVKSLAEVKVADVALYHIPDPLTLAPGFDSPMQRLSGVETTSIFYDVTPLRFYIDSWKKPAQHAYLERLAQLAARAPRLLAISECTRQEVINCGLLGADRVHTIMAGLNRAETQPQISPAVIRDIRKKYGVTQPFFLHVGSLDPHKNFTAVIQAMGAMRGAARAQLVVVGQKEHFLKQIAEHCEQMKMRDIIFTGFIPRADLEVLYRDAVALLFLSMWEGFGFPVLEAMAQDCPVITTGVSSIPEVAGDAALMFRPNDVAAIGRAMVELLKNPRQRDAMRVKGRAQAAKFSWENTARASIAVWEEMLGLTSQPTRVTVPGNFPSPILQIKPTPPQSPVTTTLQPLEVAHRDVVWFAPWQNPSGYCSEAFSLTQDLPRSLKLDFFAVAKTKSKSFVEGLPKNLQKHLSEHLRSRAEVAGKICVTHTPGSSFAPQPGAAYNIGRTMFETDRLPLAWVTRCNQMDEVWVPSEFNRETFAASGVERDKLVVIPGAVDANHFDPVRHTALPLPNRAKFNFLSVFEWSSRKGGDVLLSAYLREFSAQDDVCLYLRAYLVNQPDGDPTQTIRRLIDQHAATLVLGDKQLPRIEILAEQIPTAELPRLYKAVDCLVAPSRGEGWGRPHHEAMMMGVPVIATNWSGNTAFMNAENSYLIDYELVEVTRTEPELWHYRGHRWADPKENHLRELMRRVQQNPAEAVAKGKVARSRMQARFSCEAVAAQVVARLEVIEQKLITPVCLAMAARSLPQPKPNSQSIHVAWEGSFLDFGSLSYVNREFAQQLSKLPGVQLTCVGQNTTSAQAPSDASLRDFARRLKPQASKQTQLTIRQAWPPDWTAPERGAWVMMQPWEFGVLPAEWVKQLGKVDEAWVNSHHTRRAYIDSGVDPAKVKVVPLGIDPEHFRPEVKPLPLATNKKFKFLFVGGTIQRKGPDVLLKAYLQNFTAADDVCLVIKDFGGSTVYAGQTLAEQIKALAANPSAPAILYLDQELPPDAMPGLYAACDCLVHPYRGEGFGLPVLEAMACGLPVIVTAGGSTDDFATDEFAFRIPARRHSLGPEVSGMPLAGNGWWLEPDADALGQQMRHVHSQPNDARAKGSAASAHVRREWTWARAAQATAQCARELLARRQAEADAIAKRRARKPQPLVLPETAKVGNLVQARAQLKENQLAAAWETTAQAIVARPFHPEGWLLLAEIARIHDDTSLVKFCADRALALVPKWRPAQQFLRAPNKKMGIQAALPPLLEALLRDSSTPTLTVCLITKNEERFLAGCLKSVREFAQQIVVVDTGSTDRTVEIAKEFGAEVHSFMWCDDFSAARNAALEHATGDWILILDADEELLPESRAALLKEMQAPDVMAYRVPIIDPEEEGCSYVPRLFRNAPGLFFVGRIHEQVFSSLEVRRQEWNLENRLGTAKLLHHGYTKAVVQDRHKVARNLRLLERAIEELPNEPNLIMNFGLELVRSGQLEAGLEQYWEAFHLMSALPASQVVPELRETLLTQLATHLMGAKQFDQIVRLLQAPLAKSAGLTASLHFTLGLALMELQRPVEAAAQMRECLAKRNQPALCPVNKDIRKAAPQHCLAMCLAKIGKPADVEKAFQAALADDATSRPARFDYAKFLAEQSRALDAIKQLHALVTESAQDESAWLAGGYIALRTPGFAEFAADWTGEAVRFFPENLQLALHRAEALLLNGDAKAALPWWRKAHSPTQPGQFAALIVCEVLNGNVGKLAPPANEIETSQEFLKWYRRLIETNAGTVIRALNERLADLRRILPTAASCLDEALAEAKAA
ncbi:MAG: glycosyltransferase [Verrucomicrobia bacterium]|nr:glycosyltransferase [Verrucomicrobiota bacterium]